MRRSFLLKSTAVAAVLTFVAVPASAQTAQEEADKSYLTTLIEDNLSGDSRTVNITGFRGALSSAATLEALTIADEDGVWLTLENVVLDWNRATLLRGRIEVNKLRAERIVVSREPITEPATTSPEATPFALPELPVSIDLGQLQIDRIELGEAFLGEPFAASLTGSASLADGEGAVKVLADRLDGASGSFLIDSGYNNVTHVLGLNLNIREGAGGIAAKLLEIPGLPSLALTINGTAPLEDYTAEIALATDGQDRIAGDVRLTEEDGTQSFDLNIGGDVTPLLVPEYHDFFGDDVSLSASGQQLPDGQLDLRSFDLTGQSIQLKGSGLIGAEGWPQRLSLTGSIADADGNIVLLPLTGPKTYVDNLVLDINYDYAVSEDWTARFNITDFNRPSLFIGGLELAGGGILRPGEGDATGQVTADFAYTANGLKLDDPGVAQALGDAITGVIKIDRTEDLPTNITQLTLEGPGVEMLGEATVAGPRGRFETSSTILLTVSALERFSTLADRSLAGDGELAILSKISPLDGLFDVVLTGKTNDLAVDIKQLDPLLAGAGDIAIAAVRDTEGTRLTALNILTNEAQITAEASLTSGESAAVFDIQITDVNVVEPSMTGPITLRGNAQRDTVLKTTFDLRALAPGADIQAAGEAIPAGRRQTLSADVSAKIADLATYSELLGRDLGGAINAKLTAIVLSDGERFDADLSATTQDLQMDIAQLDPLMSGNGTLSVSLATPTKDVYLIRGLAIDTDALTMQADGRYSVIGNSNADFNILIADAQDVFADLTGAVRVTGQADLAADGAANIDVNGTGPGARFALDAQAAAETNEVSGTFDANIADLSVYRSLSGIALDGAVATKITGTALPDFSRFAGNVMFRSTDLEIGNPSVDPLIAGIGTFAAKAAMTDNGLQVDELNAQYPNIQLIGSLDSSDGVGVGNFDAQVSDVGLIADGISGPATAKGTASRDAVGTWTVDATASAPGATATIDAQVLAETQEVSGRALLAVNDLRAYRRLTGQSLSGGVTATVDGTLLPDLSRFAADISVETSDLGVGEATVDTLLRGLGTLRATVSRTVSGITVQNFAARTPNISLNADLDGSAGGTGRGTFDATLRDVGLLTDQLSGPVTTQGTAARNGNGSWDLDAAGTGPGGINLRAAGQFSEGGALNLNIDGQVPLGLANASLEPRRIDGDAVFDLAVNGPPALSSVSGRIGIDGARFSAPTLGIALTDLRGGVTLGQSVARLDIATDVDSGGTISVAGPVGLTDGLDAGIVVRLNDVGLRDPELYKTTIAGQINVTGPLAGGARISGTLNLGEAEIQVPSSGVGSLGDLPNVTHIGASSAVRQTITRAGADNVSGGSTSSAGGSAFPIDLTINAPSKIFIRGRGLDAELGGVLTLGGTTDNIIPVGRFSLIRGRLDILQQRFDLTEGDVSLQGDFEPYIRLVAATEARTGTKINIIVEGVASSPEVTFESIPDLPQDEVLSQLIFGRDLADISPLQAIQLAAAVGTLAGRGGGGLIDTFRQDIGLDDFDITTDEDGNAAVRAGAYLSENVYTDVVINSEGETEINLNLDIKDEFKATGTVGADGETSIGIFFQRDY